MPIGVAAPVNLQDGELARLAEEAEARGAALQQQCQSAVAAAAARASQAQRELEGRHGELKKRCSQLERALAGSAVQLHAAAAVGEERQAQLQAAQRTAAEATAAADRRIRELKAALQAEQCRAAALEEQSAAAGADAAAAVAAARERRAAELEEVQRRFLALLGAKDATIGALRSQLDQASEQLRDLL